METPRSLDLDGLDGIISSSDKLQSKFVGLKAILVVLLIVLAMILLFFMLNRRHSPLTSPETSTQPMERVHAEAAKILPETTAATSSVNDEQVALAATDTSSMPATVASVSASPAQPQQDSAVQSPMAQGQPDVPTLPAEPTAAGNATDTADSALFTVYFKLKSSTPIRLSEAETSRLKDIAKSCPKRIRITGHTCHLGSVEANLRLGRTRANAVKKLLMADGIAEGQIETASQGENMPAASNDTASGQAANRRAVLDCVDQSVN